MKTFRISESASGKHIRKVFNEMLAYAKKNKIPIILCEKIDRLTRNLADAATINDWIMEDKERAVHFAKESFIVNQNTRAHENLVWDMKVAIARFYTNNLSEEVKKGQKEKIEQGWLPTKPPLGYKTVGEKGHKIHIIDKALTPLIQKMFELYATGEYSLQRLALVMYEEGLRTRGGNKLVKSRVADILSDPFYIGKNRWNGEIHIGKHEPLIGEELFDRVQTILHQKTTPKYSKHFYLFKGLMHCIECSGVVTWEEHKGTTYGHCNHYRNCSQTVWVIESAIEMQLVKMLKPLQTQSPRLGEWIRKALKESYKDEIEYHTSSLDELNKRHEQIQKRLDNLYDDKLDEKIVPEFYERKFKQFTEEKELVLKSIENHSKASDKYLELGISFYELSQRAQEIYQKATLEEKRRLIGLVFENLYLDNGKLSFVYSKPFEVLAKAVTATNSSKEAILTKSSSKTFEPANNASTKAKTGLKDPEFATLLRA